MNFEEILYETEEIFYKNFFKYKKITAKFSIKYIKFQKNLYYRFLYKISAKKLSPYIKFLLKYMNFRQNFLLKYNDEIFRENI